MNRNRLPNIKLEGRFKRIVSLGIAERIAKNKEEKRLEEQEDDMRLERLGLDKEYFNYR